MKTATKGIQMEREGRSSEEMPGKRGHSEGAILASEETGAHDKVLRVCGGVAYWLSSSHGMEKNGSKEYRLEVMRGFVSEMKDGRWGVGKIEAEGVYICALERAGIV